MLRRRTYGDDALHPLNYFTRAQSKVPTSQKSPRTKGNNDLWMARGVVGKTKRFDGRDALRLWLYVRTQQAAPCTYSGVPASRRS
jgi:hypothetical protein